MTGDEKANFSGFRYGWQNCSENLFIYNTLSTQKVFHLPSLPHSPHTLQKVTEKYRNENIGKGESDELDAFVVGVLKMLEKHASDEPF